MSSKYWRGFTIIELSLFMAITGLLVATLLTGWTVSVNTQGYRDSVRSFAVMLQSQYTAAVQTTNGREANLTCNSSATVVAATPGTPRGQSDCVIMGRYVSIDGNKMTTNSIIGKPDASPLPPLGSDPSDLDYIKNYGPNKLDSATVSDETQNIPWSASTYLAGDPASNSAKLTIVIIRAPTTGAVYTYIKNGSAATVGDTISSGSPSTTVCIDKGGSIASETLGVKIDANAASQNAVHVVTGGDC